MLSAGKRSCVTFRRRKGSSLSRYVLHESSYLAECVAQVGKETISSPAALLAALLTLCVLAHA